MKWWKSNLGSFPWTLPVPNRYRGVTSPVLQAWTVFTSPNPRSIVFFDSLKDRKSFENACDLADIPFVSIKNENQVASFLSGLPGIYTYSTDTFPFRSEKAMRETVFRLDRGQAISEQDCIESLITLGYSFDKDASEPGTYKKDGDSLTIVPKWSDGRKYVVSFFDTEIDDILHIHAPSLSAGTVTERVTNASIIRSKEVPLTEGMRELQDSHRESLQQAGVFVINALFSDIANRFDAAKIPFYGFGFPDGREFGIEEGEVPIATLQWLEDFLRSTPSCTILTKRPKAIRNFLAYNGLHRFEVMERKTGKAESVVLGGSVAIITDDVLEKIFVKERTAKKLAKNLDLLLQIRPNDAVVHVDHGIGIFRAIVKKTVGTTEREYLQIEYAESDVLYVPLADLHRITKYIGEGDPQLHRLQGKEWKKTMEKTNEEVERIAQELLRAQAERKLAPGYAFLPLREEERKFREAFPYEHTRDQLSAIEDIFTDMEIAEPMDRLLSWDVGFGKTEVAMNAIYKAFLNRRQSVVISPLVVLAYEHFESFQKRLAPFGAKIAVMTRFSTERECRQTIEGLRDGSINVVVGTHRLLNDDIAYKQLGLVVIDEEHKFGVADKEKISRIRTTVDILSLSATPIPRSLNLALSGVKKISLLTTPPPAKKPITTMVSAWNEKLVQEAIKRELERKGQVIFLHNRVATLDSLERELRGFLPKSIRIIKAHGQMGGMDLEDQIIDFKNGKADILLSTTVIENGVNFLSANTIFIHNADEFGLAQLHQLRGRVGRKDQDAYCYLLYRKDRLQDDAKERLVTIVENSHLGAGFEIALRDLEIRGAGEILGLSQSGHEKETGISLYFKMLEDKIEELSSGKKPSPIDCKIELEVSYYIEDGFFDSDMDKLAFFRSVEQIDTLEDLAFAKESFSTEDRPASEAFENVFLALRAKILLAKYGVSSVKRVMKDYKIEFHPTAEIAHIREFLDVYDPRQDAVLETAHRIRFAGHRFGRDVDFLRYLAK